ncbi:MAG TPA: FAD-dependent monooxygenase [Stellaceae bacterium]|jgi:2-polyprenyl-6-methoxyphenol hydroxylase-like FAD-dependent oxidoreductase
MARQRALIVGGSVGGLFAAHLLRAHGWEVAVFERSGGALADRGASIGTRDELFQILRRIGIALDPSAGVSVSARICLDRRGKIIGERPIASINSAWDRVYRPLRDAFPDHLYRAATRVERIEQDGDSVTAILADGARQAGALLVAADGIHSTIRAQLAPKIQPCYAGYVAWRGVIEESEMTPEEHALLFGRMSFCLPESELLLALGMPGRGADTRLGRRRYYWIWFRPADEARALPALCTDATGRCHGSSIPPPLVRPEVIRALREAAEAMLAPPLAAIIRRTPLPYPHGIFDVETACMTFGRAVLLGDSAFVARPHVGAGITKAALDAQELAAALAEEADIAAALARYDRTRRTFGSALVARARHLGAYLDTEAQQRGAVSRRPETVLAEYGTAGTIGQPMPKAAG